MLETLILPDEENPLLRQSVDGNIKFANDSDREFAAARYFAEEINSGRLYIDEAFENDWSELAQGKHLEGLEYRIITKRFFPIIKQILKEIPKKQASRLYELAGKSYFQAREHGLDTDILLDNLCNFIIITGKPDSDVSHIVVELGEILTRDLESAYSDKIQLALSTIGGAGAAKALIDYAHITRKIADTALPTKIALNLASIGNVAIPLLVEYMKENDNPGSSWAAYTLGNMGLEGDIAYLTNFRDTPLGSWKQTAYAFGAAVNSYAQKIEKGEGSPSAQRMFRRFKEKGK